jgi:DNA polymerase-3 subunit epsilon
LILNQPKTRPVITLPATAPPIAGLKFDGMNISIHGIRPEDVKDEPEFPEVWAELAPHLTGTTVLAHNASFDMSVLRATLDLYGLVCRSCPILCTVKFYAR